MGNLTVSMVMFNSSLTSPEGNHRLSQRFSPLLIEILLKVRTWIPMHDHHPKFWESWPNLHPDLHHKGDGYSVSTHPDSLSILRNYRVVHFFQGYPNKKRSVKIKKGWFKSAKHDKLPLSKKKQSLHLRLTWQISGLNPQFFWSAGLIDSKSGFGWCSQSGKPQVLISGYSHWQLIGLREKSQENQKIFMGKSMVSG